MITMTMEVIKCTIMVSLRTLLRTVLTVMMNTITLRQYDYDDHGGNKVYDNGIIEDVTEDGVDGDMIYN